MTNSFMLVELNSEELLSIEGGILSQKTSWGEDIGTVLGFILGAMCKGAAAIKG